MVLPSATAFFEFGKTPVPPLPDGVLVPLGGAQGRLLQAEAATLENPSHLGRMVRDAEFPLDDPAHPPPGPDFPAEPIGRRPPGQQLRELAPLLAAQPGRRPDGLAVAQGPGSSLAGPSHPAAHRPAGDAQCLCHGRLLPALLHQFSGPQPAGLFPIGRLPLNAVTHGPHCPTT